MPRQQQAGPVGDLQVVRRDGDSFAADVFHLGPEVLEVQGDPVAQDVHDAVPEDAGRQQMQGEFALFVDDGVAGVAAALAPDDDIVFGREEVDHAALAFIAPVDPYDRAGLHAIFLLSHFAATLL